MGDASLSLAPTVPTSLQISTGFGAAACDGAPSVVAIETSSDTSATLKINGVAAEANSLVIFQQNRQMQLRRLFTAARLLSTVERPLKPVKRWQA